MKSLILVALGVLTLLAVVPVATAGCARVLTATAPTLTSKEPPLPSACRTMGPLHLGMSHAEMVVALGPPDAETIVSDPPEALAVYVFPRDLAARLHKHPEPMAYVSHGTIRVIFHNHKLVTIDAFASSSTAIPYEVGGIVIGEPVDLLLRSVKAPPFWNASKDNIIFGPYPFEVGVDPETQRIDGITIATKVMLFGPEPIVEWIKDPATGLVRGYKAIFAH